MKIWWEVSGYLTLLLTCIYKAVFNKRTWMCRVLLRGKTSCLYYWISAERNKYCAVKRCPSPFSDHFPSSHAPPSPLPISRSCPIFHSLSGRAASEEPFQLSPTSAETSGPSCSKSECVPSPQVARVHGAVVPLCRRKLWVFIYADIFEGVGGSKVSCINSRPSIPVEFSV